MLDGSASGGTGMTPRRRPCLAPTGGGPPSPPQDGGADNSSGVKVLQCLVRSLEGVRGHDRCHVERCGEPEQLLAVGAGVGGDGGECALTEQLLLVVHRWHVG